LPLTNQSPLLSQVDQNEGGFTMCFFLYPSYDKCLDKSENAFVFGQPALSVQRKLFKWLATLVWNSRLSSLTTPNEFGLVTDYEIEQIKGVILNLVYQTKLNYFNFNTTIW